MYRVVYSQGYDQLAEDYNELVRANPEYNCKILSLAGFESEKLCTTFTLSKINPEETPRRIGEYKVIDADTAEDEKKGRFEQHLNSLEAEGWVLAMLWTNYPLAIFYRDMTQSLKDLGFANENELLVFKRSGCETRQQYEQYQKLITSYTAKLDEIHKDAEEAYKLGRFGEYIRLAFLDMEQLIISLYSVLRHSDKPEKGAPPTHLLEGLCRVYQVQLVDPRGFARWRDARNRVVHENEKIDQKGAKAAQKFFEDTIGKLEKLLREMPYDLNERVNHGGFDDNLKARVDRSGFAPLAGHEGEIADLGEEDREDADDYDDDD